MNANERKYRLLVHLRLFASICASNIVHCKARIHCVRIWFLSFFLRLMGVGRACVLLSVSVIAGLPNGTEAPAEITTHAPRAEISASATAVDPSTLNAVEVDAMVRAAVRAVNSQGFSVVVDRKSTRLNSSHIQKSRMPSSA